MSFERAAGVLLHITSLPGPHGSGDLGPAAYHFVDWLQAGGQTLWQFLPLGGIGDGNSPYTSTSAFAGNVLLIDLVELQQRGWLQAEDLAAGADLHAHAIDFAVMVPFRLERLRRACAAFSTHASTGDRADFAGFCDLHAEWLHDYALFMALHEHFDRRDWNTWTPTLAARDAAALTAAAATHAVRIEFWKFCQWCFERQWSRLKEYANARGVRLIGDLPIFVALQSADAWTRPDRFELDQRGYPTVVAGVPPDAFSDNGQRWGNPLYRWSTHRAEHFRWWVQRVRHVLNWVDIVRIDHFRGFEHYWEIPASEPTAIHGRWVAAPGDDLFSALAETLGPLPIIAEDLGVITPAVTALREKYALPGMRVLQFAWSDPHDGDNHHLPHVYAQNAVVYTGTHDNDTTLGWWNGMPESIRRHVRDYLGCDGGDISWSFIRAACASVAVFAIHPMQDVLRLPHSHRMNTPGTARGNWGWRFAWEDVKREHAAQLRQFGLLYGRIPASPEYRDKTPG